MAAPERSPDRPSARPPSMRFGPFVLDVHTGELRKYGTRIRLRRQTVQILQMLLDRPGELVSRDEIRDRLWPGDTVVEFEHSINTAVQKLREALGEAAENPHYIETLKGRGYRFVAEVELVLREPDSAGPVL